MDKINIQGVILTPLNKLSHPKGDVFHGMKENEAGFNGFGEAYFSKINYGQIKGWNKHKSMTLNLIVPMGDVTFVIYDDRIESKSNSCFYSIDLSPLKYQRLTVPPGLWMAFKGNANKTNLILNIASMVHNKCEIEKLAIDKISYQWDSL